MFWYAPRRVVLPAHNVLSLNCNRSLATPPKNIAPIPPLPTGKADVIHTLAGSSYHSFIGTRSASAAAAYKKAARPKKYFPTLIFVFLFFCSYI